MGDREKEIEDQDEGVLTGSLSLVSLSLLLSRLLSVLPSVFPSVLPSAWISALLSLVSGLGSSLLMMPAIMSLLSRSSTSTCRFMGCSGGGGRPTGHDRTIKSNQVYFNTTFLKKMTQGCLQDT